MRVPSRGRPVHYAFLLQTSGAINGKQRTISTASASASVSTTATATATVATTTTAAAVSTAATACQLGSANHQPVTQNARQLTHDKGTDGVP